jgi:uncharacterized surface protein with fasciclin (FAS1) repeats
MLAAAKPGNPIMKPSFPLLAALVACGSIQIAAAQQGGEGFRTPTEGPVVPVPPVSIPDRTPEAEGSAALPTPPGPTPPDSPDVERPSLVSVLSDAANFTTLVSLLKASGLDTTLQGEGPYTVFAPTNAAFTGLPAGSLDDLVLPENRAVLSALLSYHVIPGQVMMAGLEAGPRTTVHGATVTLAATAAGPTVNNNRITRSDILAENGVIHVIETVMQPPELAEGGEAP